MSPSLRPAVGVPAGLLIVFLTLGTALPAAIHGDASDDACEVVMGGNPASPHLQAAPYGAAPGHCGVCHWLRALRVFQVDAAPPQPAVASVQADPPSAADAAGHLVLSPVPGRAPRRSPQLVQNQRCRAQRPSGSPLGAVSRWAVRVQI